MSRATGVFVQIPADRRILAPGGVRSAIRMMCVAASSIDDGRHDRSDRYTGEQGQDDDHRFALRMLLSCRVIRRSCLGRSGPMLRISRRCVLGAVTCVVSLTLRSTGGYVRGAVRSPCRRPGGHRPSSPTMASPSNGRRRSVDSSLGPSTTYVYGVDLQRKYGAMKAGENDERPASRPLRAPDDPRHDPGRRPRDRRPRQRRPAVDAPPRSGSRPRSDGAVPPHRLQSGTPRRRHRGRARPTGRRHRRSRLAAPNPRCRT